MQEKILVIWDIMLDKYTFGEVKRLNPEGPNPLLNVIKEEYRLGWSANVAANISSLAEKCDLVWLVWKDDNKNILKKISNNKNIDLFDIELENFKTIVKQRFIENTYHQQLLRVDYEEKLNKKYEKEILEKIISILEKNKYKIIVISDYNKWIIFEDLVKYLKDFSSKNDIKVLVDAKPYNYKFFAWVFLLKPNFKEFCEMIWKEIENKDSEIEKYWLDFVKKMNINLVITRWSKWASLITKSWEYFHLETKAKKVFDVSWAWDTFIATIAYALNNWYSLKDAIILANKASSIIVWKVGTAIIDKKELFSKEC